MNFFPLFCCSRASHRQRFWSLFLPQSSSSCFFPCFFVGLECKNSNRIGECVPSKKNKKANHFCSFDSAPPWREKIKSRHAKNQNRFPFFREQQDEREAVSKSQACTQTYLETARTKFLAFRTERRGKRERKSQPRTRKKN